MDAVISAHCFFDGASGFVQAGAGIVYDSDAQSEYDETKRKSGAMLLALRGIKMKFLIIDNYDSFVYNIAQYFGDLGVDCDVVRNDKLSLEQIDGSMYDAIIISPGPGTPDEVRYFGVCLML